MLIASFLLFLLIFIGIGVASTLKSDNSNADYLLAGRSVSPWLVGFSAMATNNSGYMFIGAIGYTYAKGLESIWVMFAWMFGDFLASLFIHRKMRAVSEERHSLSFGTLVARWDGHSFRFVQIFAGLITVLFLGAYAAAQFKAGGKALHIIFGWDNWVGAFVGSVIVLVYCLAGGIRASIWTDAAQTVVMFIAMSLMFFTGTAEIGGAAAFQEQLGQVSPDYLNWFPKSVSDSGAVVIALFILGYVLGGVGIVAQPHIMIRFMALDNSKNMRQAKTCYYMLYFSFCVLTFCVGLCARLLFPDITAFDSELALPNMAIRLLPEILVGLVLAGIFSASMSTADSQILSCSAAITSDIAGQDEKTPVWATKGATVIVTLIALAIALLGFKSVFKLVLFSWSILASAFAPLIIIYALEERLSEPRALFVMIVGIATSLIWRAAGWGEIIYDAGPAISIAVISYFIVAKILGPVDERPAKKSDVQASQPTGATPCTNPSECIECSTKVDPSG